VADWYDMHAQMAIDSGYVRTLYLLDGGYHYWNVPAAAIRVQVENPPVIITLTPHDPPIQIPAGGGRFQFDIDIINNDTIAYTIDAWTSITTPSGGEFTILAINNMNLPVGGTISRDNIMQFVPGTALPGLYFYNAYVQDHNTWELLAQASFHFTKLPGNDALTHNMGWACLGWEEINESYYSPSPLAFSLAPAYPNPFNPSTIITFDLPEAGEISLIIYDISGREIKSLVSGHRSFGEHKVVWNAEGLPSGIYFARLTMGGFSQTQKLLLMK
jgi:hypothetical protein